MDISNDADQINLLDGALNHTLNPWMTKREFFAAMALQGILANSCFTRGVIVEACEDARRYADSLIIALDNK